MGFFIDGGRRGEAMNNDLYYSALGHLPEAVKDMGGQELILADIIACLKDCESIFLPFVCKRLQAECETLGIDVVSDVVPGSFDAIYWGTPTVVNNTALFPDSVPSWSSPEQWTVAHEREQSVQLRDFAIERRAKRIITGLGSGDISVVDRLVDMGGGRVVSYKDFGEFQDWVLVRDLK